MSSRFLRPLLLVSLIPGLAQAAGPFARDPSRQRSILPHDDAALLLTDPGELIRNLRTIDSRDLVAGTVAVQPWSGDYWPIYRGQTAFRYADEDFRAVTFQDFYALFNNNSPLRVFDRGSESELNQLSPAEKYDLLVGDMDFNLTRAQWNTGKQFLDSVGNVETWMGLCDGWAAASYMLPRPRRPITLRTWANDRKITFYPDDIKALASLLWTRAMPDSRFVGDRCRVKKPARDANGRIIDQVCFNTNPGTLHAALATIVGIQRRSFIMDITYDYEVWNQPIRDYSLTYYNVNTGAQSSNFADVVLQWEDYRGRDPFRDSRGDASTRPEFIVGVKARIRHMIERVPYPQNVDRESDDVMTTLNLDYDLELDSDFNILGGEWRSAAHPDFLWSIDPGARALTNVEQAGEVAGEFVGDSVPPSWTPAAIRAGVSQTAPLGKVVEGLIRRASR